MGTGTLIETAFTVAMFTMVVIAAGYRIVALKTEIANLERLCNHLERRLADRNEEIYRLQAAYGLREKKGTDAIPGSQ